MDRLGALRAVVAVADHGGLSAAARRLRITPVAATRAVAQTEADLGVPLFARTTRSVRLTEAGRTFVDRCRRILADLDEARSLARGENAEVRGTLSITAPVVFGRLHVLPAVADLLSLHPHLQVRLDLTDRVVHLVEERIDVAVRIGALPDSALTAARVGSVRLMLAASPDYLAHRPEPVDLAALSEHDLIVFDGFAPTDDWRFGDVRVRVRPRLLVNGADAAVAAAERGLGIVRALSYQIEEAIAAGRLRPVLHEHAPPPIPVSLVYPAGRAGSVAVKAFVAAARARLGTVMR